MGYNSAALSLRRCKATNKNGSPCRAWARWDYADGLCAAHAIGTRRRNNRHFRQYGHNHRLSCVCRAYAWPHRPGGGLCNWPLPPSAICAIPAGTHRFPRLRQ
jgi:hypothetical protein